MFGYLNGQIYPIAGEAVAADEISIVESLQFDFNSIKVATDNFSDANKLGQGGFGAVYKVRNTCKIATWIWGQLFAMFYFLQIVIGVFY